jgi:hypothetical protein
MSFRSEGAGQDNSVPFLVSQAKTSRRSWFLFFISAGLLSSQDRRRRLDALISGNIHMLPCPVNVDGVVTTGEIISDVDEVESNVWPAVRLSVKILIFLTHMEHL